MHRKLYLSSKQSRTLRAAGRAHFLGFLILQTTALGAQEMDAKTILRQDPLSCATTIELPICEGPAGLWQLARLSLAVTATSEALRLAGMSKDGDLIQATIYLDGLRYGFHTSLDIPTLQLLDLAALGVNGPFPDNYKRILELSAFSREIAFPGTASALGIEEVINAIDANPDGFANFGSFFSKTQNNNRDLSNVDIFSFADRLPEDLRQLQPTLTLIKFTDAEGQGSPKPTSRDVLFRSTDWYKTILTPSDNSINVAATFAFTESLQVGHYSGQSTALSQLFEKSPCVTCALGSESPFANVALSDASGDNLAPVVSKVDSGFDLLGSFSQRNDPDYSSQVEARQECKEECAQAKEPDRLFFGLGGAAIAVGVAVIFKAPSVLEKLSGAVALVAVVEEIRKDASEKTSGMLQCIEETCPVVEKEAETLSPMAPKEETEDESGTSPDDAETNTENTTDDDTEDSSAEEKLRTPTEAPNTAVSPSSYIDQEQYQDLCAFEESGTYVMCPCVADPRGQVSCPSPDTLINDIGADAYISFPSAGGNEVLKILGDGQSIRSALQGVTLLTQTTGSVAGLLELTDGEVDLSGFVGDESMTFPDPDLLRENQSSDFLSRFGIPRR